MTPYSPTWLGGLAIAPNVERIDLLVNQKEVLFESKKAKEFGKCTERFTNAR